MSDKCLVHGCENHKHQGRFVGDLCAPCYTMLTTGDVNQGDTFIHEMFYALNDAEGLLAIVRDGGELP